MIRMLRYNPPMVRNEHASAPPEDAVEAARDRILEAALPHVPFDGWSTRTLAAAAHETGSEPGLVRLAFPRGPIDLLLRLHRNLDREMSRRISEEPVVGGVTDRITAAVRLRIDLGEPHREAIRRGAAFLALPLNAGDGARALFRTADAIWTALGDPSRDYNWYTKRMTLAGVYGSTALRWLGDGSKGSGATWRFLDRRIGDVMRIERAKARFRKNPLTRCLLAGPRFALRRCRAPDSTPAGMPGAPAT